MLKPLNAVTEADPRFEGLVIVAHDNRSHRKMTLADHYDAVAAIYLGPSVPHDVHDAFERARNAFLYGWFAYELMSLAEGQAYSSLELALRQKIGPRSDGKRWNGLRTLFDAVRSEGL